MDDTMMLQKTKELQEQHMQEVPKQQTMRAHLTELQNYCSDKWGIRSNRHFGLW